MEAWRGAVRRMFDSPSSPTPRRYSEEDYELLSDRSSPSLPNHTRSESQYQSARRRPPPTTAAGRARSLLLLFQKCCTLRRTLFGLLSIPVLCVVAILWSGIPPDYADIRAYERRLPQHNLSLPFPEGKDGLYLRFPGHLWGHGLNNILQETILMSYLAYAANRSFVFEDYTWSHTPFPWTIYDFALRPKRVPLNAFISGPTAGGPFALSPPHSGSHSPPRSISAEWWETVCPKAKRHIVSSRDAPGGPDVEGDTIIQWWVQKLAEVQDYGCVEVDSSERVVFDKFLFGSTRILSLWPALAASPILAAYTWSPLVQSAVARNFALLQPRSPSALDLASPAPLAGLVAVHLRRGDYSRHCPRLAEWGSTYMGLNQFPGLPDTFSPPPPSHRAPNGTEGETVEAYYLAHCLPTIPQIVAKLHALRVEHASLHRVYVLSNGWPLWLAALKTALQADGWGDLVSSVEVERNLDGEQGYVSMAVDMAIAEKAEVFVGNGFSSLSSNVVMLRMAKGLDESTNRFL